MEIETLHLDTVYVKLDPVTSSGSDVKAKVRLEPITVVKNLRDLGGRVVSLWVVEPRRQGTLAQSMAQVPVSVNVPVTGPHTSPCVAVQFFQAEEEPFRWTPFDQWSVSGTAGRRGES